MYDYRQLRPSNLTSPRYKHLLLLLFWPVYGILFMLIEKVINPGPTGFTAMYCAWDDLVPFNELFVIPYLFWFIFIFGILFYSLFWDIKTFRKFMYFVMFTYISACIIFVVFPNGQELRPPEFTRSNILTDFMKWFYTFDTNTNVCPSLHVIGSMAVLYASWDSKHFSSIPWRIAFTVTAVLISVSTVFLKQHSLLDIPPALILSAIGAPLASFIDKKLNKEDYTEEKDVGVSP